ncbi:MAG TPA: hypothetical protein PLU63_01975 [Candidatus Woesebacteria bacterium]|nr:hypothetical protein [Candidatus Woesebacteria bacterium]
MVVIAVSLFSITNRENVTDISGRMVATQPEEGIVSFSWQKGEKPVLLMTASEEVSIGAIDLYIGYKNVEVIRASNLSELPEPAFLKVSSDNSLVVLNYLISEDEGFKIYPGQSIRVVELDVSSEMMDGAEVFIDEETNVVDNDTMKGLPYKSESLMFNSSLE